MFKIILQKSMVNFLEWWKHSIPFIGVWVIGMYIHICRNPLNCMFKYFLFHWKADRVTQTGINIYTHFPSTQDYKHSSATESSLVCWRRAHYTTKKSWTQCYSCWSVEAWRSLMSAARFEIYKNNKQNGLMDG